MNYDYISERYEPQMEYYSSKSVECRRKYHFWSVTSIVCSALVPVVALGTDLNFVSKVVVALLGASTTICSSILLHFRYQELWFRYRNTHNSLQGEHEQYSARIGAYKLLDDEAAISLFAEKCEQIMEQEHTAWKAVYDKPKSST